MNEGTFVIPSTHKMTPIYTLFKTWKDPTKLLQIKTNLHQLEDRWVANPADI